MRRLPVHFHGCCGERVPKHRKGLCQRVSCRDNNLGAILHVEEHDELHACKQIDKQHHEHVDEAVEPEANNDGCRHLVALL